MPLSLRCAIRLIAVALFGGALGMGCEGCQSEEEVADFEPDVVEASIGREVVAVARLSDFSMRHFDIQHWWAEAVQMGRLVGRENVPGGIAPKPTSRFRSFMSEIAGDAAQYLDWERQVDVGVWLPEGDSGKWRWAVVLGMENTQWLQVHDDWTGHGLFGIEGAQEGVRIFSRSVERDEEDVGEVYVAIIDETTVAVSNFKSGGLHIGEAVELTGESGVEEAELYVWPRRLGISERYRGLAERLEQKVARRGHDLSPVRSAIAQLQARMIRAAGDDEAWPEVVRLWLEIERDEQTRGAQRVELKIDAFTGESTLLSALGSALETGRSEKPAPIPLPPAMERRGHLEISFASGKWASFFADGIPRSWGHATSLRLPEERRAFEKAFEDMISHSAGPTVVAFFGSHVPTGMTADMYAAWETSGDEAVMDDAREFHHRLMRDIWMPLFGTDQFARREKREIAVGDEKLEAEQKTLHIGHGHGELGVCWAVRERSFLSYYGVMPCQRLQEIVEGSEESAKFEGALSYHGELRGVVETLYLAPEIVLERGIYSSVDVEIDARWPTEDYLRVTVAFTDLPELAEVVEATPRLRGRWDRESMFRTPMPGDSLELGVSRFHEPGVTALGLPGFGGVVPPSFLLGIPFAHPPAAQSHYQFLFFTEPGAGHHHHHHHHHH